MGDLFLVDKRILCYSLLHMKYLKMAFAGLVISLAAAPALVHADVVTQDILSKISKDPGNENHCALTESIVNGQEKPIYGQTAVAAPLWKTLTAQGGLLISIPWSPYWYIVGKQIQWYEFDNSENPVSQYWFGRYQAGDACSLKREYYVDIYAGQTFAKHFVATPTDSTTGKIFENFTLNGRPAALVSGTNPFCDQESIAVQIYKNSKPYTLVFSHFCGDINAEMIRMAARVK